MCALESNSSIHTGSSSARTGIAAGDSRGHVLAAEHQGKSSGYSGGQEGAAFHEGQVFHGSVINITAKEVTIRLDSGEQMSARYEGTLDLSIGESTHFKVMSAGDGVSTYIKSIGNGPGLPVNSAIQKALDAAGLPLSERNVSLVSALLRNHMSVSKTSILSLLQLSSQIRTTTPDTLAVLTKYHIPATPENVKWFDRYNNQQHQLLGQLQELTSEINQFNEGLASTAPVEFIKFHLRLFDLLQNGLSLQPETFSGSASDFLKQAAAMVQLPEEGNGEPLFTQNTISSELVQEPLSALLSSQERVSLLHCFPDDTLDRGTAQKLLWGELPLKEAAEIVSRFPAILSEQNPAVYKLAPFLTMPPENSSSALFSLSAALLPHSTVTSLEQGTLSLGDYLQVFGQTAASLSPEQQNSLFSGSEYHSLTAALLKANWTLKPDRLLKESGIRELYENIRSQLDGISAAVKSLPGSDRIDSAVRDVKENIQFMNTLNELYNYVQLPLRLTGQETQSELYVFANKKSFHKNGGSLTAVLSLTLSTLGSLDIHISLSGREVKTKFYVEEEKAADLIKAHIAELNEALAKKGYHNTDEVLKKEKPFSFRQDFIEQDAPPADLKRYTFDVRA